MEATHVYRLWAKNDEPEVVPKAVYGDVKFAIISSDIHLEEDVFVDVILNEIEMQDGHPALSDIIIWHTIHVATLIFTKC